MTKTFTAVILMAAASVVPTAYAVPELSDGPTLRSASARCPRMAAGPTSEGGEARGRLNPLVASRFASIESDPAPSAITNNRHYVVSNESYIHLFEDAVRDSGGVMIGVGTDQMYVMAGWARPEVLVLADFDQMVVDLHAAYRALVLGAEDPERFIALWQRSQRKQALALIAAQYPNEPKRRQRAARAYRYSAERITRRLEKSKRRFKKFGAKTFLSDPVQYQVIRDLFAEGRVFEFRGDLKGSRTFRQVAEAARASGLTVRVLYLSNTEMYFTYNRAFKDNMAAMPFDGYSVALRTMPIKPMDYMYIVQAGSNFQSWVSYRGAWSVWDVYRTRRRVASKPHRRYVIDAMPGRRNFKLTMGLQGAIPTMAPGVGPVDPCPPVGMR